MEFKDVALKAAKEAGKIHLKYYGTKFKIGFKEKLQDKVTIADIESEKKIVSIIKKNFDHNILAEEGKYKKVNSPYLWVIDPLDGTNNFSHNFPFFATSIALLKNGSVILGVVYDPLRNELFFAEKGKGATLNGKKIKVTSTTDLRESLLSTGFYYDRGIPMEKTLNDIKNFFLTGILGIRRSGSAALDLCFLACGRIDGFWEFKLSPWDFAAGKIIIEEAGGKFSGKNGEKKDLGAGYVVASNSKIHKKILKIIK